MIRATQYGRDTRNGRRAAFTILEMLIAMALTLLMMASLGRAFKYISDTMRESRAGVELSTRLRTVAYRMNDELGRCTARLEPSRSSRHGEGYFCYYDGPMTDSTTLQDAVVGGIPGVKRDDRQERISPYYSASKFGDLDDYLAFTAVAEAGADFTGIVPYFIQAYHEREVERAEAIKRGDPPPPFPPTLSPAVALAPTVITSKYAEIIYWLAPTRDPESSIVIDRDGDGLPDSLRLHRRVLLIRPDLNLNSGDFSGTLPYYADGGGVSHMTIGSDRDAMRTIHQQCDLSVRRPISTDGKPQPEGGSRLPVIANSLSDLSLPHARFAHVRGLESTRSGADFSDGDGTVEFTSMPLIDVSRPNPFLQTVASNLNDTVRDKSGFLHQAYELGGDRIGEDVVLVNVAGFDIRGFDPRAPVLIHVGADGVQGSTGDDDGDGEADNNDSDFSEYGAVGSDDVVVTPGDPGFYNLIRSSIGGTAGAVLAGRGTYVDVDYVHKGAGNVLAPPNPGGTLASNLNAYCVSPLSGYQPQQLSGYSDNSYGGWRFPESYLRSGKVVLGPPSQGGIRRPVIYQPVYDTWTSDYESDGHNQGTVANLLGTVWTFDGNENTEPIATVPAWTNQADEGSNGIDDIGSLAGVDDFSERESSEPYRHALTGVQVRLRIEDPGTQRLRQMTITRDFVR